MPAIALSKVTTTTLKPLPIWAKSGPGHAPVTAQPKPKMNPPMICPFLNTLSCITTFSPCMVLIYLINPPAWQVVMYCWVFAGLSLPYEQIQEREPSEVLRPPLVWKCDYHIVWTPKYRFRILSGLVKKLVDHDIKMLCDRKNCQVIELKYSTRSYTSCLFPFHPKFPYRC